MEMQFHGRPDPYRIANALSIILSERYNAEIVVKIKGDDKGEAQDARPDVRSN